MSKRKSWTEKLQDSKDFPRVEKITDKMSKRWGTGTVVIPAPMEQLLVAQSAPAFLHRLQPALLRNKDKKVKKTLHLTGVLSKLMEC